MDNEPPDPKPAPRKLISELDRSRDDLAVGRLTPILPILTAMQARAASRLERRERAQQEAVEKSSLPR